MRSNELRETKEKKVIRNNAASIHVIHQTTRLFFFVVVVYLLVYFDFSVDTWISPRFSGQVTCRPPISLSLRFLCFLSRLLAASLLALRVFEP